MKKFIFVALILVPGCVHFKVTAYSSQELKEIVRNCFKNIFENPKWTKFDFDKYISKDYVQQIDGKTLNYEQTLAHIKTLKKFVNLLKLFSMKWLLREVRLQPIIRFMQ